MDYSTPQHLRDLANKYANEQIRKENLFTNADAKLKKLQQDFTSGFYVKSINIKHELNLPDMLQNDEHILQLKDKFKLNLENYKKEQSKLIIQVHQLKVDKLKQQSMMVKNLFLEELSKLVKPVFEKYTKELSFEQALEKYSALTITLKANSKNLDNNLISLYWYYETLNTFENSVPLLRLAKDFEDNLKLVEKEEKNNKRTEIMDTEINLSTQEKVNELVDRRIKQFLQKNSKAGGKSATPSKQKQQVLKKDTNNQLQQSKNTKNNKMKKQPEKPKEKPKEYGEKVKEQNISKISKGKRKKKDIKNGEETSSKNKRHRARSN